MYCLIQLQELRNEQLGWSRIERAGMVDADRRIRMCNNNASQGMKALVHHAPGKKSSDDAPKPVLQKGG